MKVHIFKKAEESRKNFGLPVIPRGEEEPSFCLKKSIPALSKPGCRKESNDVRDSAPRGRNGVLALPVPLRSKALPPWRACPPDHLKSSGANSRRLRRQVSHSWSVFGDS